MTQDGVALGIDHHLVLILAEILDWIALTGVAIKYWNRELFWKIHIPICLQRRGVGCINGDDSVFGMVWHSCFLDLLSYKLVEILNADELFDLPLSMIVLIPHAGM